ncbi:MAG: leucine-rich repeat protein, partial [Muribaculaceae bacterium]|nr:leucine-rich repeat protein [Muribaculaceae bacterium]
GCKALKSIEIPASVTALAKQAFYNCSALESIKLNKGLETLGENALRGTALTELNIPEGVTTVGKALLYGDKVLTKVTLPSTITTIDAQAFYNCTALAEVHNRMAAPLTIVSNVFYKAQTGTLYVPKGTLAAYQVADVWKSFKSIVEEEGGDPQPGIKGDVNGDEVVDITDANILINIVLGKDTASKYSGADVTGDGSVDISDVNTALNIILGK